MLAICEYNAIENFNDSEVKKKEKLIVFAHGAGGRGGQFQEVCEYLQERHTDWHLVHFDQVGHGQSFSEDFEYEKDDFKFEMLYSNLEFIVNMFVGKYEKLGHPVEVVICGHSVGSGLSMKYTLNNPTLVTRLVLMGTKEEAPGQAAIWKLPVFSLNWLRPIFSSSFSKLAYHEKTPEEVRTRESEFTKNNSMFMMKSICTQLDWPTHEDIGKISCPTLIIAGETDGITKPEQGETVSRLIQGSKYTIIKDASHNMMLEKPQELAKIIEEFLINY